MGTIGTNAARGRAAAIAHVMKTEAAFENKPNHIRHVENQIRYVNAVCEATTEEMKEQIMAELPKMIQEEIEKALQKPQVQVKVDERSLSETRKKISDMLKSIFHG